MAQPTNTNENCTETAQPLNTHCTGDAQSVQTHCTETAQPLKAHCKGTAQPGKTQNSKMRFLSSQELENNIYTPNPNQIIKNFAKAIWYQITDSDNDYLYIHKTLIRFDERFYRLTYRSQEKYIMSEYVYKYIRDVFLSWKVSIEIVVVAVLYIDRFTEATKIKIHRDNWRLIVFVAMMIAAKVWEEDVLWNAEMLNCFPERWLLLRDVNEMEIEFLRHIKYNLSISQSVYAWYYFELGTNGEQKCKVIKTSKERTTTLKRTQSYPNKFSPYL